MRVLIVSRGRPNASIGDTLGLFEWDQAVALAEAGVRVTFFAIDLRSIRRRRPLGHSFGTDGSIVWHTLALPIGAVGKRLLCAIGRLAARILYRKVYRHLPPPQIIHAHFGDIGNFATAIKSLSAAPLVITEHNSAINEVVVDSTTVDVARVAYLKADAVIAVSRQLASSIKRLIGIDALVIPDMLDTSLFNRCQQHPHEGFAIATVSNLIPRKNTLSLLKALSELHLDYPDISLHIVGDGPLRQELEQFASEAGLNGVVFFHGHLSREETCYIYEQCDCMAMVSRTETFGVVYVEAMAAGLPVIATRCGGPEDFVNESNGVLVEVDNIKQLKSAILHLRSNRSQYRSADLRHFVDAHFSPRVVASQLVATYNTLLGNTPRG